MPIINNVESLNHALGEVYLIQQYVIQFVSDLQQVGGFLRFPPPIKLTQDITEILMKVALNTINLIPTLKWLSDYCDNDYDYCDNDYD